MTAAALVLAGSPPASADPATDAQGFVDSTARCPTGDTAVAFGSTASSRVAICKSAGGAYQYRGVRISDGAKLIAAATDAYDYDFWEIIVGLSHDFGVASVGIKGAYTPDTFGADEEARINHLLWSDLKRNNHFIAHAIFFVSAFEGVRFCLQHLMYARTHRNVSLTEQG